MRPRSKGPRPRAEPGARPDLRVAYYASFDKNLEIIGSGVRLGALPPWRRPLGPSGFAAFGHSLEQLLAVATDEHHIRGALRGEGVDTKIREVLAAGSSSAF